METVNKTRMLAIACELNIKSRHPNQVLEKDEY